jgi:hypothetical protein
MSLFEHISATDDAERVASRTAAVVASKRFDQQFGSFVKGASSQEELVSRMNLIDNDLQQMVAGVVEEFGGDARSIEDGIKQSFLERTSIWGDVASLVGDAASAAPGLAGSIPGAIAEGAPVAGAGLPGVAPLGLAVGETLQNGMGMVSGPQDPAPDPASNDNPYQYQQFAPGSRQVASIRTSDQSLIPGERVNTSGGPGTLVDVNGDTATVRLAGVGGEFDHEFPVSEISPFYVQAMPEPAPGYFRPYGSTKVARRPKMCPYHSELTDSSLQAGEPQYAAFSSLVGGPSHCKGGFDGKCNFKPEMVTQEYWDNKQQESDARREQRDLERQQQEEINPIPDPLAEDPAEVSEGTGITDLDSDLSDAPSAVGEQSFEDNAALEPMALTASNRTSEVAWDGGGAKKTEKLPTGDESALGGPSPEMETKKRWGGEDDTTPPDTEMNGTVNPTIRQTLWELRDVDHVKDLPRTPDEADSLNEKVVTLPTADKEDANTTEKNLDQSSQGGTWTGTDGMADPVTSDSGDLTTVSAIIDEYEAQ